MKKHATPKPGTKNYDVEKTGDLNIPKYHSSSDHRHSNELPSIENLNNQPETKTDKAINDQDIPKTDLGNKPKANEKEREKIIKP